MKEKSHLRLLPIQDGLSTAVQIVKLLLGHRIVDIHSRDTKLAGFGELIQPNRKSKKTDCIIINCLIMFIFNSFDSF